MLWLFQSELNITGAEEMLPNYISIWSLVLENYGRN